MARLAAREQPAARKKQTRPGPRLRTPWLIGGLAGLAGIIAVGWFLLRPGPSGQGDGAIATLQTLD